MKFPIKTFLLTILSGCPSLEEEQFFVSLSPVSIVLAVINLCDGQDVP